MYVYMDGDIYIFMYICVNLGEYMRIHVYVHTYKSILPSDLVEQDERNSAQLS